MRFDADLYCALHTGTPGDVDFYGRAGSKKTVLELGGGDGRISEAIVRSGGRVYGLDAHPGMVELAKKRRNTLGSSERAHWQIELGDMSQFTLDRRFDLVAIPYSGIFCLEAEARTRCFQQSAQHLNPGGQLIFDAYATEGLFDLPEDSSEEWSPLTILETDSGLVLVHEREQYGPGQIVQVEYRFERIDEGRNTHLTTDTIVHHCFEAHEVAPWLFEAGFSDVKIFSDFKETPYDEEAEHMVILATYEGIQ